MLMQMSLSLPVTKPAKSHLQSYYYQMANRSFGIISKPPRVSGTAGEVSTSQLVTPFPTRKPLKLIVSAMVPLFNEAAWTPSFKLYS